MPDKDYRQEAHAFADLCAGVGTGMANYWLERATDRMWAICADRYMIPAVERIHAALVAQGITEDNQLDFNDLDDKVFYIPVDDVTREYGFKRPNGESAGSYTTRIQVFVHCTQNQDYLYVLNSNGDRKSLHIRRIWRTLDPVDSVDLFGKSGYTSIQEALADVAGLEEYSDYPRSTDRQGPWRCDRPSLETYRALGFQIPNEVEMFNGIKMYGDFRDTGYVLSFEQELFPSMNEFIKAEHVDNSLCHLIMDCFLPSIEYALKEAAEGNQC